MSTLTLDIGQELLEAAKLEADRRHIGVDQLVKDYFATTFTPLAKKNPDALLALLERGLLNLDAAPLTREEIYADRLWPRS